jgi:hypothetical protein
VGCANVDTDGSAIGFTAVWGLMPATSKCFSIRGLVDSLGEIWFEVRDLLGLSVLQTQTSGAVVQPGDDEDAVRAACDQAWTDADIAFIPDDPPGDFCFFDTESREFTVFISDDGVNWQSLGPGSAVTLHGVTFSSGGGAVGVPAANTGWLALLVGLLAVVGVTSMKRAGA